MYLERSKTCPIFLTWFTELLERQNDAPAVIEHLVIPAAEGLQRITVLSGTEVAPGALLVAMESLDFQILRDIEISCDPLVELYSPTPSLRSEERRVGKECQ